MKNLIIFMLLKIMEIFQILIFIMMPQLIYSLKVKEDVIKK